MINVIKELEGLALKTRNTLIAHGITTNEALRRFVRDRGHYWVNTVPNLGKKAKSEVEGFLRDIGKDPRGADLNVGSRINLIAELVVLLDKYDAEIFETTDGNGIHVEIHDEYTQQGFHTKQDMKDWLRESGV